MLIGERAARVSCPYQQIDGTCGQGDTGTRGDAKIQGRVVRKKSLLMRGVFAGTGCGGKKS